MPLQRPGEPAQRTAEEGSSGAAEEFGFGFDIEWGLAHELASEEAEQVDEATGDEGDAEVQPRAAVQMAQTRRQKAQKRISTPLPKGARIQRNLSAVVTVTNPSGAVTVTIKPDKSDRKVAKNSAYTSVWVGLQGGSFKTRANNTVRSFVPYGYRVTIQTKYGPGAKASHTSGYGRGTTPTDKKNKKTTLKFHEGSHGTDYLKYLKANALPKFKGAINQSASRFRARQSSFKRALGAYAKTMQKASEKKTDCVGTRASFCKP